MLLFSFMISSGLTMAQGWSVGGYLTPTFGNIVNKGKSYKPAYQPIFTIGGGLTVNYSKNRWMLNSGLNYKYPGASKQIPVTTVADPDGNGETKALFYFEHIIAIPLGIHYAFINNVKFELCAGLVIENGQVLENKLILTGEDFYKFDRKQYRKFKNGYYMGVMPRLGAHYNLSSRKFLFANMGLSYQLNFLKLEPPFASIPEWGEKYKVNNLFIDIGFAYRLKN